MRRMRRDDANYKLVENTGTASYVLFHADFNDHSITDGDGPASRKWFEA